MSGRTLRYSKPGASEMGGRGERESRDKHVLSGLRELALERPVSMVMALQFRGQTKLLFRGSCYHFRGAARQARRARLAVLQLVPACVSALPPAMSFLKSFPPPGSAEGLRQQQPDTEAVLNGKSLGTGTLYIAESRLSWLDGSGLGFSLEYPTISLHAVSRDLNAYPREHLYVMVNAKFGEESKESVADEEEEDSDDDVEPIAEFRFVPSDKSALEAMFTAMCECQALHPDPEDEDSDDYDGEEYDVEAHEQGQGDIPTFYTYEEGLSHLTPEGQATLERLEGMLSQSVSSQYNMAGVRTEDSVRDYEDGMEVDTTPTVAGQFEDADVDH